MANDVKWTAAGLDAIHAGYRGSGGNMAGFSNLTAASVGLLSGMRRLKAAKTAPVPIAAPVIKPILGDDGVYDSYLFASADPNQGVLELSQFDVAFENAVQGTTSATAVGDYTWAGRGGSIGNPANMMYLLTRQAHSFDSGSGVAGFENELVLNAQTTPLYDESKAHQQEGNNRYQITFNEVSKTFRGTTMSAAAVYSIERRQSEVWFSQYRSMIALFVGDGALTETPALDYAPVSAATTKAFLFSTGAALTVSSVNTTTKTVTLSAAPASGALVVIVYQVLTFG